jgi:hypothetical protein
MPRIELSDIEETAWGRLLGHFPELLSSWRSLEHAVYQPGLLGSELKEQVRATLALGTGCEYCQACGDPPNATHPNLRESLAVTFADLYAKGLDLDDATFEVLRAEFSEQELVELFAFVCLITASQRFGALFRLERDLAPV